MAVSYSDKFYRAVSLFIRQNMTESPAWTTNILNSGILVTSADLGRSFKEMGGSRTEVPFFTRVRHDASLPFDATGEVPTEHTLDTSSFIGVLMNLRLKYSFKDSDVDFVNGNINIPTEITRALEDDRQYNNLKVLLSVLKGALASPDMADHVLDETTTDLSKVNIIDIIASAPRLVLGDKAAQLNIIMAHSAIVNEIVAKNRQSMTGITPQAGQSIALPSLFGFTVIENDDLPYDSAAKVGSVQVVGSGSIFGAEGRISVPTETRRDEDKEVTDIFYRWNTCVHPVGMSFTGGAMAQKLYPTFADLANGSNWARKYDSKNIPLVSIKVKLPTATIARSAAVQK